MKMKYCYKGGFFCLVFLFGTEHTESPGWAEKPRGRAGGEYGNKQALIELPLSFKYNNHNTVVLKVQME